MHCLPYIGWTRAVIEEKRSIGFVMCCSIQLRVCCDVPRKQANFHSMLFGISACTGNLSIKGEMGATILCCVYIYTMHSTQRVGGMSCTFVHCVLFGRTAMW